MDGLNSSFFGSMMRPMSEQEAENKQRRGRPRLSKQQADASKTKIVGVARNLFAEHGYEGVSIRKIAKDVECSLGVIYNHFESKREILQSIWDDILLLAFKKCHDAASEYDTPLSRLRIFCTTYVQYWRDSPEHFRMIYLLDERGSQDQFYPKQSFSYLKYQWVTQQIETGVQSGELRSINEPARVDIIAKALYSLCQGLAYATVFRNFSKEFSDANFDQDLIESAIDALLAGYFDV